MSDDELQDGESVEQVGEHFGSYGHNVKFMMTVR